MRARTAVPLLVLATALPRLAVLLPIPPDRIGDRRRTAVPRGAV